MCALKHILLLKKTFLFVGLLLVINGLSPSPVRAQAATSEFLDEDILAVENFEALRRAALLRVRIYMETGKWKKAEAELRELFRETPEDPEVLSSLATVYVRQGQPEAAEKIYRYLLRKNPNRLPVRLGLAYVLYERTMYQEVVDLIEPYYDPTRVESDTDFTLLLAASYDAVKKSNDADSIYHRLTERYPEDFNLFIRIAENLLSVQRINTALYYYRRAEELRPDDFRVLKGIAIIVNLDDPGSTRRYLRRALELDTQDFEVPYLLAESYFQDFPEAARKFYRQALERLNRAKRKDIFALSTRARILFRLGEFGESEVIYRSLVSKNPSDLSLKNALAEMLIDIGKYKEALLLLEKYKGLL
ncbi:MAG: tetratricopeptide repeat protein [Candidatus Lindowbacteria bacterium]|nr:tetratricopeptide repeat protein [Candidatus Lindowbacteria bacterium]